jgi:6-phospho-beta-glucosidase
MSQESFLTIAWRECTLRPMGLKVAVVGGGSTYTPELIEGFCARADTFPVDELVLHDIDEGRLAVVGGLARRILARAGGPGDLSTTGSRESALEGADFVIVQLRVGGQRARLVDETLPLRWGCIGQETTGPGGFAKALRTVPVVIQIAHEVAERAAPGAWIVDFTNPVGIVTQALLDEGHRAVGLCNVAIGFQRRFASVFGVEPHRVELEHVGLNHLSWERAVRVDGTDRLEEVLDRGIEEVAREVEVPADLIRLLGAIPSGYLRYYYMTGDVLEEQRSRPPRAEEVMAIESELLELYRDERLDAKPAILERRGGAYYSEAAAQLVASLHSGGGDAQVVDVRNNGAIPNLADDDVVEVSARVDSQGAHPLPVAPLEPELLGLVEHAKAYERLAAEAALTGSRSVALRALMTNPLVGGYPVAEPLLGALLEANRQHLPRFWPPG